MSSIETDSGQADLYTLEFKQRPKYLYALVSGKEYDLETAKKYWLEMLGECRRQGFEKLLVEEDMTANLSMQDMYEISSTYCDFGFPEIFVAFVDRHPSHKQLNRFGEMVATNRGNRIRVFDTVAEAKQWLLVN